jgi:hypothetical protein
MGCRTAQGYLFSPPMPGDAILERLAAPDGSGRAPVPFPRVRGRSAKTG